MPHQSPAAEHSVDSTSDVSISYEEPDDFDTDSSEVDESDHSSCSSENDYLAECELIGECNLDNIIGSEPSCSTEDEKLIYPNARITNAVSMLLIMSFAVAHRLTGAALKDL